MTLKELCAKHKKGDWPDKDSIHSYIDVYEEILAPYRTTAGRILEIGLMSGESLRMWEDYFNGNVHGIDCDEQPHGGMADLRPMIKEGGHNVHILDATDKQAVDKEFTCSLFDVIIEDAGHSLDQQLKIYEVFKNRLSKNGIYIIEDVQDIDKDRQAFIRIDPMRSVTIHDRRKLKGRYDDVLIVIQ